MKPLTREWVNKAEGDYATATREARARKSPNYDATCFHAQQCVEKYLKAVLQECGIAFGRTHNLEALLAPLLGRHPEWAALRPMLRDLTAYAVETRYPGESSDKEMARQALAHCRHARSRLRVALRLGD
ncbi:MAG: DNA-binding protein [Betaproteobacteria bacterium RIFCSPLOWO2_02_FULL_63_19]|nr:MAG: DNA-binding protein [Betaproteobacteria bacterium RIFCSPLOWO2_02_FULL_63_19]